MYIIKYSSKTTIKDKKIAKPARVGKLKLWTKLIYTCNMGATKLTPTCNMRATKLTPTYNMRATKN